MMTKNVNIFDRSKRKIRCVEKVHDYLGNGKPFTEDELEVGRIYTFVKGSAESYGNVVCIEEFPSGCYQAYLFEELKPYDDTEYRKKMDEWLDDILEKGYRSIQEGRTVPAEEVFEWLERYDTKI